MTSKIWVVLACCFAEAAANGWMDGLQDAVEGAVGKNTADLLKNTASHVVYDQLPQEMLKAAGFPTEKELICKALNNTRLQGDFKDALCIMLPKEVGGVETKEACHAAVAYAWKQELSEEGCPGAPKPWWPFHVLHEVANKLICYELKHGNKNINQKEKDITDKVCKTLAHNPIDHWACEEAMKHIWDGYEKDCKSLGFDELLEQVEKDPNPTNIYDLSGKVKDSLEELNDDIHV